ncbi:hypothetical protein Pla52n_40390 [Stieleria varia]|uniref:Uncharacterized protein n=1 Tax=Stieleria varia TaxID=2528005 RepID=A0A5C6ATA6_9BACT|nr:hypothetical protein Pla52n_40390 [Stieleria varia]
MQAVASINRATQNNAVFCHHTVGVRTAVYETPRVGGLSRWFSQGRTNARALQTVIGESGTPVGQSRRQGSGGHFANHLDFLCASFHHCPICQRNVFVRCNRKKASENH